MRWRSLLEWGRVLTVAGSAYATLQWACASIGAILVTINPAYRTHELVGYLFLEKTAAETEFYVDRRPEARRRQHSRHRPPHPLLLLPHLARPGHTRTAVRRAGQHPRRRAPGAAQHPRRGQHRERRRVPEGAGRGEVRDRLPGGVRVGREREGEGGDEGAAGGLG